MSHDNVGVCIIAFHPDSYYSVSESENNMSSEDLLSLTEIMIQNNYDICAANGLSNVYILCDTSLENIVINSEIHQLVFTESEGLFKFIEEKKAKFNKLLVLSANIVGLTAQKLDFMLNMLDMEEEVSILGVDYSDRICFTASCSYDRHILAGQLDNMDYHGLFKGKPDLDYYYILLNNVYSIANLEDFRRLYGILSQRENFNLCSKDIYDRFTELFIEYKELIS